MGYEPIIRFMKQLQGKMRSSLYAPLLPQTNPQHFAFLRQLQKELKAEEGLMIPLKELIVVVFDLETTGFFPEQGDQILSIGAVKVRGEEVLEGQTFYSLVRCERDLPITIKELTGITEKDVWGAPVIAEVLVQFFGFTRNHILVAHHSNHEKKFMQHATRQVFGSTFQHRVIDTSFLMRVAEPNQVFVRLEDCCSRCGIAIENRHHALGDAKLAARLWSVYLKKIRGLGYKTLQDVYEHLAKL